MRARISIPRASSRMAFRSHSHPMLLCRTGTKAKSLWGGTLVQAMAQAPAGEPVSTDREGNSDVRFGVVSLKLYSLEALLNGVDFK